MARHLAEEYLNKYEGYNPRELARGEIMQASRKILEAQDNDNMNQRIEIIQ